MTSKRNAVEYVKLGGAPVRVSVFNDPEMIKENPSFPVQLQALDRSANLVRKGIMWIPPNPKLGKALDVIGTYGSRVLDGELTAEQAMQSAQKDVEQIMQAK